uniref:Uncharacterized protein n=1 Tax=Pipistrellus kuhlii TaxID=59472 RepID=A0A7J7ZKA3_PIPKU|nr:hypothetical protein mPipKuh1_009379 [Pipistrellus kuhlii]
MLVSWTVATASELCPQLIALPERLSPSHNTQPSARPPLPPPGAALALLGRRGGGEEVVCGALLTRPAWPAASSARHQEPQVRLGRRSGASGPLFCACGLQVRSLRPPGVLWLLLFRTPRPPGLQRTGQPHCPSPGSVGSIWAEPSLPGCSEGQGSRLPSRLSSQASVVPIIAGFSSHFRDSLSLHTSDQLPEDTVLWEGGQRAGPAGGPRPQAHTAWRPAHLAQPVSSVP